MNIASFLRPAFAILVSACIGSMAVAQSTSVLTVTSLKDKNSPGTLRSALKNASCGDVIEFAPALFSTGPGTIRLSNGLAINKALTVAGPGADLLTIDGGGKYQVVSVTANCQDAGDCGDGAEGIATVTLSGITIRGGVSSGGGGVLVSKNSCVNLISCRLIGNETKTNGGGSAYGGGIYNRGILVMDLCVVEDNLAGLSSIPGNPGGSGGGLYNEGDAVVTRSLFVGNQSANGGGLTNGMGTLIVESSTFSGNADQSLAGGLLFDGGVAELSNLTVFGNTSILGSGAMHAVNDGLVAVRNTILAGNAGPGADNSSGGSIVSYGYNLFDGTPSFAGADDRVATDPMLGVLADNGGQSSTHAPMAGSPALNGGDPAFSGFLQGTDQRGDGFARVVGVAADIGAYEENNTHPTVVCPGGTVECGVDLISVAVADEDGDPLTVTWSLGGIVIQTDRNVSSGDTVFLIETPASGAVVDVRVSDGSQTASCQITVLVLDRIPPEVTLNYLPSENGGEEPLVVECGSVFVDPGAFATDVCDGSVTVHVTPPGSPATGGIIDTSVLGDTTLVYTAVDGAGNSSFGTRTVRVVDTTPPVISPASPAPLSKDAPGTGCSYRLTMEELILDTGLAVVDGCDPSPVVRYWLEAVDGDREITIGSVDLAVSPQPGGHTIRVEAADASGNAATPVKVGVAVNDVTAPIITLNGPSELVLRCGESFEDAGATAFDTCDGAFPAFSSGLTGVDGAGLYEVVYSAVDRAGNPAAMKTLTVRILPSVVFEVPSSLTMETDPGFCTAQLDLAELVAVTGACVPDAALLVTIELPDGSIQTRSELNRFDFPKGVSGVVVQAFHPLAGEDPIAESERFAVTVNDNNLNCAGNNYWPVALDWEFSQVFEDDGQQVSAVLQQYLSGQGERRWIRIRNTPVGARLTVALSNPSGVNYDLTVYRDIQEAYNELLSLLEGSPDEQISAVLGTQFSPEAFAPDAFAPDAFAPDAFAPDAFAPDAFAPDAFAPDAFAPDAFAPDAFAPDAFAPDAFAPDAFAPDAFAPDAFAPDAFAAAQNRVLASFSAFDGPTDRVRVTNFEATTDYYVRVSGRNGASSVTSPFTLLIEVESEICDGVTAQPIAAGTGTAATTDAPMVTPDGSAPTSLILWDKVRMTPYAVDPAELQELEDRLADLAAAANGVVLDVSSFANVVAFNVQADLPDNRNCPYAKNLVAEAIHNLVRAHIDAYPTINDITIVGNDDVIPFFRRRDDANLANEAQYFPPVLNSTHSQSALRTGRVLEQDTYGSDCRVVLSTGEYNLPKKPVGRLVEMAADVIGTIELYLPVFDGSNPGLLPEPAGGFRALSVAYDFMADAGVAIENEMVAGLNVTGGDTVSALIADPSLAPAESWTAKDLKDAFFDQDRIDLAFLGAHFSTSSGLAADYLSRFTAAELELAPVDLTYALAASQGCHSGYNTVNPHAIESVTLQPDWAQAFARKGAILVAGTGYQYGETQLLEYGERLYLEFFRQLRTEKADPDNTGAFRPVTVGEAVVNAKLNYLAQTPNMRGIHEKTLLVGLTLYGLPMVTVDLPNRVAPAGGSGGGLATTALGGDFGLQMADLFVEPVLTRETLTLEVVGESRTVEAAYYVGSDGAVSMVAEPIRPLESEVVGVGGAVLRGVVLRSASYLDETPFLPLTGAPATEIRGVAAPFKSEVYYPIIPWATNQVGELCGGGVEGSVLNVFPAQFRSDPFDPAAEPGTLRRYTGLNFSLSYSDAPGGSNPARFLTPAPAIDGVVAELSSDGSEIVIEVVVETSAEVGIEEVLATYTGEPGSTWYGSWESVVLEPTTTPQFFSNSLNAGGFVRTWTASLPVGENDASGFRFIMQTIGKNGPAGQTTNFGRGFRVGGDPATGETPTSVSIVTAPASGSGAYGTTILVEADVSSDGTPVGDGERVDFRLGPLSRSALTVGGRASSLLTLYAAPRDYDLEVTYRGSDTFAPSSASQALAVVKQATTLGFEDVPEYSRPADWFARLQTVDGKPLKEKTVVFVIENTATAESFIVSEITDGAGRAAPGSLMLPTGSYAVAAYFATAAIPGTDVSLVDPLYTESTSVGVFDVALEVAFGARSARVTYNDTSYAGLVGEDRGLSIARLSGDLELADPTVDPTDLLGDPSADEVTADLLVRLSGQTLVDATIVLNVASGGSETWKGTWSDGGTTADLELIWSGSAFFDSILTNPDGPRIRTRFIGSDSTQIELTAAKGNYTVLFEPGLAVSVKGGRIDALSGFDPFDYVVSSSGQVVEFTLPYSIGDGQVVAVQGRYSDIPVVSGVNLFPVEGRFGVVIHRAPGAGPAYSNVPAILEATIAIGTGTGEIPAAGTVTVGDEQTPWTEESGPVYRKLTPGDS